MLLGRRCGLGGRMRRFRGRVLSMLRRRGIVRGSANCKEVCIGPLVP
jgi:hypothetical protein